MIAQNIRIRRLVLSVVLCLASATAWALDTNLPPSGNFDLRHWKLQLPVDSSGGTNGSMAEIPTGTLTNGYTSQWFYTASTGSTTGAMTFWAWVVGATSSGSSYPRSELREVINPNNDNINWILPGTHILNAQCKVLQVPSTKTVIIGQIHAVNSVSNLPTVKIYYDNGIVYGTVKTNALDDDSDYNFANNSVGLSNSFTYMIKVVDGLVSIAINNHTNSLNIFQTDPSYTNIQQYFKAGDYCQDNVGPTNEGARVAFTALTLFHAPSITNQPVSQTVTAGANVTFTVGASGNPPLKYFWQFNGTPINLATNASLTLPNVQPTNAGNYSVIITDYVGTVRSVVTSSVAALTVQVPLITADFTATPTNGVEPLNVAFTDTTPGSPTNWAWSFGDAGTSALQNPSHNYTTAGVYTVRLIASQTGGSSTNTKPAYVTVLQPAPSGLSATALSETQVRLAWTDTAGNETAYGVGRSLDSNSWSTLTSSLPVNSTNYTDATCSPSTLYYYRVHYTNSIGASAYAVVSLTTPAGVGDGVPGSWRLQYFGNGLTTNSSSCATCDADSDGQSNQSEFLTGFDPTNSASSWHIQANPTNGVPPLLVSFTENSTGSSITNRSWDFGDGGIGSGSNPSHTYTNTGVFSVGVTILSVSGTAMQVKSNLITVSPSAIWTNANASGNWSVASSWDPVTIPDNNCGVIFGTAGVTANVDTVSRTVSNITFSRLNDFSVTASGGGTLMISNGITVTTNFTYTISAPVVLGGTNTWSVTSNGVLRVSGPVSGSEPIIKTGGGVLILSDTNTYDGETTVSNGVLKIVGAGLITNTPSIDIAGGATLDVSGRTGGSLTLVNEQILKGGGAVQGKLIAADGSTLSPGSSADTLTFLNDLAVSNAAVLEYDLGTSSDLIAVGGNLTLGGTLNITDAGGFGGGEYTLFTYGGTLTYDGVTIGAAPLGYTCEIDTNTAGEVRLNVTPSATISVEAADLQDRFGNLMPISGVAVLVADTGADGFVDLQPAFTLSLGATWGVNDRVVGLWDLSDGADGVLAASTIVPYTGGLAAGQGLQLYWLPSLTLASNTVGVTYYGKYSDTNSPPLDGSDVWETGPSVFLKFSTAGQGGSNPDTAGRATLSTATAAVAGFTAGPISGLEPLLVNFTDTSTGLSPLSLTWNFGDSTSTNTAGGASFVHAYAAGTYNVTLTASNSLGASTLVSNNLITVITAFQAQQLHYFTCTDCPQAQGNADPDGDGMSNTNEFLAGFNPTRNAAYLHIISVAKSGSHMNITYLGANGDTNYAGGPSSRTNVLEYSAGSTGGTYTNSFISAGQTNVLSGGDGSGVVTNMVDQGGATNTPSRYYRVRVLAP